MKKNKEIFLSFDEYNAKIKSESWKIFAEITSRSV